MGSQSVIVVLDVKKKLLGGYEVFTHNGEKATGISPIKFAEEAQRLGVEKHGAYKKKKVY